MFGHSATHNDEQDAVKKALCTCIKYSNEAQALIDCNGTVLFKNQQCKLNSELSVLPLPSKPIEVNDTLFHQEQVFKIIPINENLFVVKPQDKIITKPINTTNASLSGIANEAAFTAALAKVEKENKNKLLVILEVLINEQSPANLLNTIAELLSSCWRSGDTIFYLGSNKFSILYNNAPDLELVKLRLANIDNILKYKGYKNIAIQIGHATLESANNKSQSLLDLANSNLQALNK